MKYVIKSISELDKWKKRLIQYLNSKYGENIEKAKKFAVGTIRHRKGGKYKKIREGRWVKIYEGESRGKNISVGKLISKIKKAESLSELVQIVAENKERFYDDNGRPDKIISQFFEYAKKQRSEIGGKKNGVTVGSTDIDRKDVERKPAAQGRIKTARQEFTKKSDTNYISEDIGKYLREHQRDFVNLALDNYEKNKSKSILCMDGTGAGKTIEELTLAQEYLNRHKDKPILIVTENDRIIKTSFTNDSNLIGVDIAQAKTPDDIKENKIYITRYQDLGKLKNKKYGLVLFDESHNLKNSSSQKTVNGKELIENADKTGLFSATPLDKGNQIAYISKAFGLSNAKVMKNLGYELVEKRVSRYQTVKTYEAAETAEEIAYRLDNFFTEMTKRGFAVKREVGLENMDINVTNVNMSEEDKGRYDEAVSQFKRDVNNAGRNKGIVTATGLMKLRRLVEETKINDTVKDIENSIKQDKQIVLFATRVNDSDIYDEESLGTLKEISRVLKDKNIDHVSVFDSSKTAKDDIQKFQDGKVKVILTTPQSGGTGLSLDDTVGNAPRKAIVMTPPFSAMDFIQMTGRINRMNTKSRAEVSMMTTDTMIDEWNKTIISNKLTQLGATVKGDYEKLDLSELEKLQYMSDSEARDYLKTKDKKQNIVGVTENRNVLEIFDKIDGGKKEERTHLSYPLRHIDGYRQFIPKSEGSTDYNKKFPDADISFGKYNGKKLSQLKKDDFGYFSWMVGNLGLNPNKINFYETIQKAIRYLIKSKRNLND